MILASRFTAAGTGNWVRSNATESTVPIRAEFSGDGLLRIEGRNDEQTDHVILGFMSESGVLVVPTMDQYRAVAVTVGTSISNVQRGVFRVENNPYKLSPQLQFRQRSTPRGIRKAGFRCSHVLPFDFIDASAAVAINGTIEKDYTNCRSGEVQSGESLPYSIKQTSQSGTSSELRYDYTSAPVDITGGTNIMPTIRAMVYVDPAQQQVQSGPVFKLTLGLTDVNNVNTNITMANWQQFDSSAVCGPGWNLCYAQPTAATIGTSIDLKRIKWFRLYCQPTASNTCYMTLDSMHFLINDGRQKFIAFRDDDGYANCVLTAKEFDKWGIRGNFHVHPRMIGQSGYATKADLLAMQKSGHLIGNHGWNKFLGDRRDSDTSGPFYKQREVSAEDFWKYHIYPAMAWLQDNGFEQGSRIYATHQGNMTPDQRELLLENGIDIISHTSTSAEQSSFTNHLDCLDVQHATPYGATVSLATLDILDEQGGLAVFYGHGNRSKENSNMLAVTNRAVPLIKSGEYRCITLAEAVARGTGDYYA